MTRVGVAAVILIASLAAAGCSPGGGADGRTDEPALSREAPRPREAPPGPANEPAVARPRIVALGDSLTAGLGLDPGAAYPAVLQRRIDQEGLNFEVVNAGVSGETSAGGLRRVDWVLEGDVRVLIVALGGNDGLRGLPVEQLEQNLSAIVERAQARGITVILAGMEAPPNFGPAYTASFRDVYARVAKKHRIRLIPFLLEGVAGLESMNQRDGIHPTAEGASQVAENVWAALEPIVTRHD
jgi:acyl-CoA thioesterase-1